MGSNTPNKKCDCIHEQYTVECYIACIINKTVQSMRQTNPCYADTTHTHTYTHNLVILTNGMGEKQGIT